MLSEHLALRLTCEWYILIYMYILQGRFSYKHLSSACKTTLSIPSLQVKELLVSLGALNH